MKNELLDFDEPRADDEPDDDDPDEDLLVTEHWLNRASDDDWRPDEDEPEDTDALLAVLRALA